MSLFCLDDYDCIGFDFDQTILRYNVRYTVDFLGENFSRFMSKRLGHDCAYPKGKGDFIQRGIFFDAALGNFLKIGADFRILRASHGTRFLGTEEIRNIYGKDSLYPKAKEFLEKGSKSGCYREGNICFTDIFSSLLNLISADLIEDYDSKGNTEYPWIEAVMALQTILDPKLYESTGLGASLRKNVDNIVDLTSIDKTLELIKELRRNGKKVFILTTGVRSHSNFLCTKTLGPDWTKYFDLVLSNASKPDIFRSDCNTPFVDDFGNEVSGSLEAGGIYSKGNYTQLYTFFQRETRKQRPKILYFGDDLYSDIYGGGKMADNCEAVAILDEMSEIYEGPGKFKPPNMMGKESELWGSLFYDVDEKGQKVRTLWAKVIDDYAKIKVPSLECFLQKPWNHKYEILTGNVI